MNTSKRPVFAIDIPSGLNADTGLPLGIAVKADTTATFGFAKIGHILFPGNLYTGKLEVVDIGIPNYIAREKNIALSLIEKKTIAALFCPDPLTAIRAVMVIWPSLPGHRAKPGQQRYVPMPP